MHGAADALPRCGQRLGQHLLAERRRARSSSMPRGESGLDAEQHAASRCSSLWDDFDEDGDLDLYVVNDFGRNNLYQNDGRGHFEDVAEAAGALDIGAGMGASAARLRPRRRPGLVRHQHVLARAACASPPARTSWAAATRRCSPGTSSTRSGNTLLRNRGDGSFEDVTAAAGVAMGRWAWGGMFTDFNNDGLEDLYVPCGHATQRGAPRDLEVFYWQRVVALSPPDASPKEDYATAFAAMHRMVMYEGFSWSANERNVALPEHGRPAFRLRRRLGRQRPGLAGGLAQRGPDGLGRGRARRRAAQEPQRAAPAPPAQPQRRRGQLDRLRARRHHLQPRRGRGAGRARAGCTEQGGRVLKKRVHAGDGFLAQSSLRLHFGLARPARAASRCAGPGGPARTSASSPRASAGAWSRAAGGPCRSPRACPPPRRWPRSSRRCPPGIRTPSCACRSPRGSRSRPSRSRASPSPDGASATSSARRC